MFKWKFLLSAVGILAVIAFGFLFYKFYCKVREGEAARDRLNSSCEIKEQPLKVSGGSLSGYIEDGAEMKALMGYYACNPVERGDLVLYLYGGNKNPLIKIAKGLPGDKFSLEKKQEGCWNILINGVPAENFAERPYCLNDGGQKMLALYERDYKGVIPDNAYLILGNMVKGSLDSSRFGLVGKRDLAGKAVTGD